MESSLFSEINHRNPSTSFIPVPPQMSLKLPAIYIRGNGSVPTFPLRFYGLGFRFRVTVLGLRLGIELGLGLGLYG